MLLRAQGPRGENLALARTTPSGGRNQVGQSDRRETIDNDKGGEVYEAESEPQPQGEDSATPPEHTSFTTV